MKIINEEVRKTILKEAINIRSFAGFEAMPLLPKSCDKLKKVVKLQDNQQFRALRKEYDGRLFFILLLDGVDNNKYWAFWEELEPKPTQYYGVVHRQHAWRGYTKHV